MKFRPLEVARFHLAWREGEYWNQNKTEHSCVLIRIFGEKNRHLVHVVYNVIILDASRFTFNHFPVRANGRNLHISESPNKHEGDGMWMDKKDNITCFIL
jgi:hypothetical protein